MTGLGVTAWRVMARYSVVAQVGVEAASEPVLGVAGEQPEHHLQAAPPSARYRDAGFGVYVTGGQLAGDRVAGFCAVSSSRRAAAILRSAGISMAFLTAGVMDGSASRTAKARSAAAARFFSCRGRSRSPACGPDCPASWCSR